jgi:DNA replication protein DnaC
MLMPEELCPICEGAGLRVVERGDGTRVAAPCECRAARRSARMLEQARIPQRYAHCTLDEYVTNFAGASRSLASALVQAQSFVKEFPLIKTDGKGLLFVGRPGLGKTHLSVGILGALILQHRVKGLFVDYRDLLKQVQNSYDPAVSATELSILRPVFNAEVLVIDDLGASKPTDWVFDTVAHILNSRYNDRLITIITTNFANLPEVKAEELVRKNESQRIMSERTLGDRIGDRVLSRLPEMCVVVEMSGEDFRQKVKRASFA